MSFDPKTFMPIVLEEAETEGIHTKRDLVEATMVHS